MRIWDYFETGLSWTLNYIKNRASAQSDWAFGSSLYRFQPSLTHDVLFSVVQSVSKHSESIAAKAAIGNWIVAYVLSKVILVQSMIRCWLVYRRNRDAYLTFRSQLFLRFSMVMMSRLMLIRMVSFLANSENSLNSCFCC